MADNVTRLSGSAFSHQAQTGIPAIEAFDLNDFLGMKIKPRRFVLDPWLREKGLALIHAKAGIGKSWFGLCSAYAIATGTKFLKWQASEPLRVVYLDGEMAAEDVQQRMEIICKNGKPARGYFRLVSFDLYDGPVPNLASEEGQKRLAEVTDKADVIFVDNLSCLSFDGDRSDAESWQVIQSWLLAMRRRNKSVVLFHHSGKGGTQRGTSKRADALDVMIRLDRPADATGADGCRFTVTFEKARGQLGSSGEPFEAMLVDGMWQMKTEDQSQLLAVADLLAEGNSIRKVATELGMASTNVYRLKKQAMERGLL